MNYGMYLSATGVISNMHRQDVLANNLANLNTVAFKPDVTYTVQRLPQRLESPSGAEAQRLLERLGGGHLLKQTLVSLKQGTLTETGNNLDFAINGEGFFVVAKDPAAGQDEFRLTRDGRFTLNKAGEMVMAGSGLKVLDIENKPIILDQNAAVHINPSGLIVQDGKERAQLQIVAAVKPADLVKQGNNVLKLKNGGPLALRPATGLLVQEHVEASSVDPVMTLSNMISASKAVAANVKLMQYHDHLIGQAVNTLGRVA